MLLNDICPNIFIINLLRRTDRFDSCRRQMENFKFSGTICIATDARDIKNNTNLRDGENALLHSYKKIIEYCKNLNYKSALIFEDDFIFEPDFNDRLSEFNFAPQDWNLIYFGRNAKSLGAGFLTEVKVNEYFSQIFSAFGAHAILINENMYDPILDGINKFDKPLDVMYVDLQQKYNAYAFTKPLVKQMDTMSDIINFNPGYAAMGIFDG